MATISLHLSENDLRIARCDMLDKLIAVGDGDAALLYIYILRNGDSVDTATNAARALHMPKDRMERAEFTLNGLVVQLEESARPASVSEKPPQYTMDELRRARQEDHKFSAICLSAEEKFGQMLNLGILRCLYTAYDFLGLSAEAIIELLAYLKDEKGIIQLADIRKETNLWADMGIVTAQDAQSYLARKAEQKPLAEEIYTILDADPAKPSPKQQRLCDYALARGFLPDAVELAMRRMERQKGRRSLDYLRGILRGWDESGVHTVSEITALEPETQTASGHSVPVRATAYTEATDSSQLSFMEQDWLEQSREITRKRKESE